MQYHIKSYVIRKKRISTAQKNAISLLPKYSISYQDCTIDIFSYFNNLNPIVLEIGFGMGDATWQIAKTNPDINYLVIELHIAGVGALINHIQSNQLTNIRIINYDAFLVIKNMLPPACLSGVHIFFPDPWPKKRHYKRRLIQTEFINLLCTKLIKNAYIHLATDWEDYALWILAVLNDIPELFNSSKNNMFIERPDLRPMTKFEKRGINLGHKVFDLMYYKR